MNGKYQFSFDNRHVVSGLVAAAVVLGAVFVLGVVVGKKVALDQRAAQAPDLLTALDDKSAAIEKPATPTLTFQEELTKSSPAPSTPPAVSPAPAQAAPQALARATSAPVEAKPQLAAVPSPSEPVRGARPPQSARPVVPVKAQSAKPEGKSGIFTLQLSSTQTRADANRFAARLREKGYAPTVVEAQVPGRGTWYRVRLGNFSSRETATRFLTDFRRETQLDAYVAAVE